MNKICINLYGGKPLFSGKEKPLTADIIYCDYADTCSLCKNGKCLRVRRVGHETCMYGSVERVQGYTSKSSKYYDWRKKYTSDDTYAKLKRVPSSGCFAVMGNYYYFETGWVYARFNGNDLIIDSTKGHFFLEKDRCTPEMFVRILNFRPTDCFGVEIKKYADVLPRLLLDIKTICPDLYAQIIALDPNLDKQFSFIGKTVYVNTMTENSVLTDDHGNKFILKDGNLVCDEYNGLFSFGDKAAAKLVVPVTDKMTYSITDESQTDDNTKLAD